MPRSSTNLQATRQPFAESLPARCGAVTARLSLSVTYIGRHIGVRTPADNELILVKLPTPLN